MRPPFSIYCTRLCVPHYDYYALYACARCVRPLSTAISDISSADISANTQIPAPPTARMIQQLKNPSRGGQNLSARYDRLERSLRGKAAYGARIQVLGDEAEGVVGMIVARSEEESAWRLGAPHGEVAGGKPVQTFRGFVIPEEPRPPESDECCMSGCAICVYDLYSETLEEYTRSVDTICKGLSARRIPYDEWPASIRRSPPKEDTEAKAKKAVTNVIWSAFEELERKLRQKHKTQESAASVGYYVPGVVRL